MRPNKQANKHCCQFVLVSDASQNSLWYKSIRCKQHEGLRYGCSQSHPLTHIQIHGFHSIGPLCSSCRQTSVVPPVKKESEWNGKYMAQKWMRTSSGLKRKNRKLDTLSSVFFVYMECICTSMCDHKTLTCMIWLHQRGYSLVRICPGIHTIICIISSYEDLTQLCLVSPFSSVSKAYSLECVVDEAWYFKERNRRGEAAHNAQHSSPCQCIHIYGPKLQLQNIDKGKA